MIYTWITDAAVLGDREVYEKYYRALPLFRQQKADRIQKESGRVQSVAAWALWQRMQAHYGMGENTPFNLSHSGRWAVCSASDTAGVKVGCDIEIVREARMKVAERFFCPSEKEQLRAAGGEEQRQLFYRYWVLKESFMKAVRLGMALDTRSFEIGFDGEDRPFLKSRPAEFSETYYYKEHRIPGCDACIAVCATQDAFSQIRREQL